MKTFDLVIHSDRVHATTAHGRKPSELWVGVRGGKIAELSTQPLVGAETLDARGLDVVPGIIDSQVHFREPGLTHKEDLESGTRSALLGGVTSIFEMPNTKPPTISKESFDDKVQRARGRAWSNFAFFMGAAPENIPQLGELEKLPGCPGVKVFMGSSTGSLLVEDDEHIEALLRHGRRRVIVHSEDEYILRSRKSIAVQGAHPRFHHEWRNVDSALNSTQRLLRLSEKTGRPVHVLHVTTAEEVALLAKHKSHSTCEVLPQHLTLFAPDCYERLGSFAQMNPPIREKRHQEALWKGVQDGTFDVIGSDHAPHTREEKSKVYPDTPSGMPGVQTLVPIMLTHVAQGRLSLDRFLDMVCENPRRVFGCETKGRIEVGRDADFTILDLRKTQKISNSQMASKVGWTPFDGFEATGWPVHAVVGGHVALREGQVLGAPRGELVQFTNF